VERILCVGLRDFVGVAAIDDDHAHRAVER
jgi:hypothetical protein